MFAFNSFRQIHRRRIAGKDEIPIFSVWGNCHTDFCSGCIGHNPSSNVGGFFFKF